MSKILLVEDDKSLREIYGVRLLAEGYDIVSAGDGEEALAMAIKDRPDLIVSDVMMPKISGFDMLDILRSTTETKDIKVIMMTALSSEEQRQRGVSLGADRYLVKSQVGIEDVVRMVHEVLADAPVTPAAASASPTVTAATAAPVVGSALAPEPAAAPVVIPPAGAALAPVPTPAAPAPVIPAPAPTAPIAAAPIAPVAPAPVTPTAPINPITSQPVAPMSTAPAPAPQPVTSTPVLPQPTAPFSTPRTTGNTLASRVIQPLNTTVETPDFGNLMNQELGQTPVAAPAPAPAAMNYEETPRPAAAPVAPTLPTPPQAPNTGV
jgi:CheY-like chemotaxis protein